MPNIKFSTVSVPENEVNLGHTQWGPYYSMSGREEEFKQLVEEHLQNVKTCFRNNGEKLSDLLALQEKIKVYRHYSSWRKIQSMIALIKQELTAGAYQKVVLFAQHADLIKYCQYTLLDFSPVTLYAKTNPYTAEKNLKKFNNLNHKCRIFISIVNAARAPIVLGATKYAFFLQDEMDPKSNLDAILRLDDTDKIYVRNFCLENDSTDRRVEELIRAETLSLSKPVLPTTLLEARVHEN